MQAPTPVELSSDRVHIEPMTVGHAEALFELGREPAIWAFMANAPFETVDDARRWIEGALEQQAQGSRVCFAINDRVSGRLAGTSSYLSIEVAHRGIEIGWTWYGVEFQRTHVNTETKRLLLGHAFDTLGANRVQLQTDRRNERSQNAIARIGGVREGVLRKHKVYDDGYVRDSVFFSILREEWPDVEAKLTAKLAQQR